jgi:hypothetical protein
MVRCASGVTTIRQRAVAGPAVAKAVSKVTPGGAQVVAEHPAELVVAHLANIGALAAERGDARDGVAA